MKKKQSSKKEAAVISTEEFDHQFDEGASVIGYADLDTAVFRVNVDFPAWTVSELDKESNRLGISRQSLIKIWVTERLDQMHRGRSVAMGARRLRAGIGKK